MKAVLIFDNVNDLVFSQWDDAFITRMKTLGGKESEGELSDNDTYIVSQLLSPVITSQRVMGAQFGNTYSSMKCKDGTNLAFDEWLDHVLLIISEEDVDDLQRELLDLKTLIQHICGQNFKLLHAPVYREWLSELTRCGRRGDAVPGAGGAIGASGATAAALAALRSAAAQLAPSHQHFHLLLYVGDKLLALYSSRGCEDLTPADLILLSMQCVAAQDFWTGVEGREDASERAGEGITRPVIALRVPWLSAENSAVVNVCAGSHGSPCAPHSLHVAPVAKQITFAVLLDLDLREVGVAASTSTQILSNLRRLLLQRNLEAIPPIMETLENSVKKTAECLRRHRSQALAARLAARMQELKRSCGTTAPLTPETAAAALHTALDAAHDLLRPDVPRLELCDLLDGLRSRLEPYVDFLRVKAMRYFSLGSEATCSLTRHKYAEEFPGLVHFVMVERTAGRVLAPDLADCADMLTQEKVRAMLRRGMRLAREGYTAAAWCSGALHACLVLWWEARGAPVAPRAPPHPAAVRALPVPGDILSTFYKQLTELCFPEDSSQVVVKELLCIHLGLLPAATAVQQARRLAHAVQEVSADTRPNPADLL